jgi:hypothetical protein
MELEAFAERVTSATTLFKTVLKEKALNNDWFRIYERNISQYDDTEHINMLYLVYLKMILEARKRGYTDILDIGSGIQCAKMIDPTITSSNPQSALTGTAEYFQYINHALNIEDDVVLADCIKESNWINTHNTFDCLLLIRFFPWDLEILPYTKTIYKNIICELDRTLRPDGVVWYNPISHDRFETMAGDTYQLWEPVEIINTPRYYKHYGPIYQITKSDLHTIALSL